MRFRLNCQKLHSHAILVFTSAASTGASTNIIYFRIKTGSTQSQALARAQVQLRIDACAWVVRFPLTHVSCACAVSPSFVKTRINLNRAFSYVTMIQRYDAMRLLGKFWRNRVGQNRTFQTTGSHVQKTSWRHISQEQDLTLLNSLLHLTSNIRCKYPPVKSDRYILWLSSRRFNISVSKGIRSGTKYWQ